MTQRQSLATSHRQRCPACSWGKRQLSCLNSTPLHCIAAHTVIWHGISLWTVWIVSACIPSLPLVHPWSIQWLGSRRNRGSLDAVQMLPSSSKKSLYSSIVLVTNPKHSIVQAALKRINPIPARPGAHRWRKITLRIQCAEKKNHEWQCIRNQPTSN